MTPLQSFTKIAQALAARPSHFWTPEDQTMLPTEVLAAVARLKKTLEAKRLNDTLAYQRLLGIEASIGNNQINEALFIQNLSNLVEVYRSAPLNEEVAETFEELDRWTNKAKKLILEYQIALEALRKKGKKMTDDDKAKADMETINKVGLFYVLEYTLQVLHEFTYQSDDAKRKLLDEGLKTEAGNLPGYRPLEESFRRELCLKIFDPELRDTLLRAFYDFEQILFTDDLQAIGTGLKQFNLALLHAFAEKGLTVFHAVAYAPFGNDLPIGDLASIVEQIQT